MSSVADHCALRMALSICAASLSCSSAGKLAALLIAACKRAVNTCFPSFRAMSENIRLGWVGQEGLDPSRRFLSNGF